ncbi:hypothetical protein [Silvibacterium dinghuense]|uniref:Uncharacterized protein n=1 Tax=Silvibacterium dinghuense TaxID=1560006 RepID=A0A4Q1SB77_9BACT|nr:hypothetical protein [Silvibacterium dinghuense]RXS94257.1 hypothetical protein ESZ00_14220 [Silvibacterium dinghuense]
MIITRRSLMTESQTAKLICGHTDNRIRAGIKHFDDRAEKSLASLTTAKFFAVSYVPNNLRSMNNDLTWQTRHLWCKRHDLFALYGHYSLPTRGKGSG